MTRNKTKIKQTKSKDKIRKTKKMKINLPRVKPKSLRPLREIQAPPANLREKKSQTPPAHLKIQIQAAQPQIIWELQILETLRNRRSRRSPLYK